MDGKPLQRILINAGFVKAPLFVLFFFCYMLMIMIFLIMLSLTFLCMLILFISTVNLIGVLICGNSFFFYIIYTKHEWRNKLNKKHIKIWKPNIHLRHTVIMKAAQNINILNIFIVSCRCKQGLKKIGMLNFTARY